MQAAVDMGLSEHMTGKLFNVPSVTRVLKELRMAQETEKQMMGSLPIQSRQALESLNKSLED